MRAGARRAALVAAAVGVALTGCAGRHLRDGVYRSEHGFRVTVPGPGWAVVDESRAELELRRADGGAGMLVHATCRPDAVRRSHGLLARQVLLGLRERATLEAEEADVAGRRALHQVVEGRPRGGDGRMRVESYVLKGARCVYDLLYVAPPDAFDGARDDFRRFVHSFVME